jgi:hypothetical protein
MGIFDVKTTPTTQQSTARPELWVPERLAVDFADAHAVVSGEASPMTHLTWVASIESRLPGHLTAMLDATEGDDPTPDDNPRSARVEALADEVLADSARAWAAYVHLLALDDADRKATTREARERELRQRAERETCSVCGQFEPDSAQRLVSLYLDTGAPTRMIQSAGGYAAPDRRDVPIVWGHAACVHEAIRQHSELTARDVLADGRTRSQAATDWLAAQGLHRP